MIITDLVFEEIRTQIATHPPERGGALYGPKEYPAVSHFEYDKEGDTSASTYVPSSRLITNVAHVERETGLQFKGIIHSHPAGFVRPSHGDQQTVGSFFRLNPHFSAIALPIVQEIRDNSESNAAAFLRWYRVERRAKTAIPKAFGLFSTQYATDAACGVAIIDEDVHIVPIWTHVAELLRLLETQGLKLTAEARVQHLKISNAELISIIAQSSQGHEFIYCVTFDYPTVPPIILYRRNGTTRNLRVHWDGLADMQQSLRNVAETLVDEWRPDRQVSEISVMA